MVGSNFGHNVLALVFLSFYLLLVWTRHKIKANLQGKRKKKIPGYPGTSLKHSGIFGNKKSRDILFRDFPGFKILGLKIPGFLDNQTPGILTPGIFWSRDNLGISRDRDIPSTSLVGIFCSSCLDRVTVLPKIEWHVLPSPP